MKTLLSILIIFITLLLSCEDHSYENREMEARQKFDKNTSAKQKQLVNDFFDGKINYGDHFNGVYGGFYCLWKRRDMDISPHISLNDMFVKEGYKVTTNRDSLNFIIISERISHKVGTYTNGGDALKMETIISVINLKNDTASVIDKTMGSDPPSSSFSRVGSGSGSSGSWLSDEDIFDFLKTNIIKQ